MFKKVLIAEDMDVISAGLHSMLSKLRCSTIHQVKYCDDAYLKIKKSILDKSPYDLLITDLSFISDYRDQEYKSGESLIKKVKNNFPSLKVIVFSVDNRYQKVRDLINNFKINAYVCKSRDGLSELKKAIKAVHDDEQYLSTEVVNALNSKSNLEINDYDVVLLKQLSLGLSQPQISTLFLEKNILPHSISSIEKRLNKLKDQFIANNTTHLVAIVKDLGLI